MKNIATSILATTTVALGVAVVMMNSKMGVMNSNYKDNYNKQEINYKVQIAKLEANCTNFETVNLQTIHPYNQCIKLTIQYAEKQGNNKMNLDKVAQYCQPLLIDRKEYKEYKEYNNSSGKK